jgi:hypothetical protein
MNIGPNLREERHGKPASKRWLRYLTVCVTTGSRFDRENLGMENSWAAFTFKISALRVMKLSL